MPTTTPAPTATASGVFDPSVESDGLTFDTPLGPVDRIAIDRARNGRPVDLTAAEVAYLLATLPAQHAAARTVAAALDLTPKTVLKRARRHRLTAEKVA
jgi:hypothetical protein